MPSEVILWCNGFEPQREALEPLIAVLPIRVERTPVLLPMADSWNHAASLATTEMVHLLHDDDWIEPQFYLQAVSDFQCCDRARIWFGSTLNHFTDQTSHQYVSSFPDSCCPPHDCLSQWIFADSRSRCVSTVFSKDSLAALGGFDSRLRQLLDIDLFWRMAKSYGAITSSKVLGNYRIHSGSATGYSATQGRQPAIDDGRLCVDLKTMLKKYRDTTLLSAAVLKYSSKTAIGCMRYGVRRLQIRTILDAFGVLVLAHTMRRL